MLTCFSGVERTSAQGPQGYMIVNHFRQGIWLLNADKFENWPMNSNLQDLWFPFQRNRWYSFQLVVQGEQLDYYIDDRWMLSYNQLGQYRKGKILLGTSGHPTEFDDLRIYRLGEVKSSSSSLKSNGLVRK